MCGKRRKIINHVLILDFGTFESQKSQNNWKGKIEEGVKRGGKRFICFFFFLFSLLVMAVCSVSCIVCIW